MLKSRGFALAAVFWVGSAATLGAQPIELGGDIVAPLENRPALGLFVQGYVNGHGPYRFEVDFAGKTTLTPDVVKDAALARKTLGATLNATSNQVSPAASVTEVEVSIGGKTIIADNVRILSDRDLSTYTPVRTFGGFIGVELLRAGVVTFDGACSQIRLASRSFDPGGEPGSTMIALDDSVTLEPNARPEEPLPSVEAAFDERKGRFRLNPGSSGFAFLNRSTLGADLVKASPFRFRSLNWTPDGLFTFEHGAIVDAAIGGRHVHSAPLIRIADTATPAYRAILDRFPVEGVMGTRMFGAVSVAIDNDGATAWIGPPPAPAKATGAPPPAAPTKTIGLTPWLYKGRGVARQVIVGGPADLAGIAPGDEIVSLDGAGVIEFYEHMTPKSGLAAPVKVVFRNASGEHLVVLVPAPPRLDQDFRAAKETKPLPTPSSPAPPSTPPSLRWR